MQTRRLLKKLKISAIRKMTILFPSKENCMNFCSDPTRRKPNSIVKNSFSPGVELRTCKNCNTKYRAILTPIGYVEVSKR
jgi:hypothetical protein